jgi:hypothetical protein
MKTIKLSAHEVEQLKQKGLTLHAYGVKEMNQKELIETDGGIDWRFLGRLFKIICAMTSAISIAEIIGYDRGTTPGYQGVNIDITIKFTGTPGSTVSGHIECPNGTIINFQGTVGIDTTRNYNDEVPID